MNRWWIPIIVLVLLPVAAIFARAQEPHRDLLQYVAGVANKSGNDIADLREQVGMMKVTLDSQAVLLRDANDRLKTLDSRMWELMVTIAGTGAGGAWWVKRKRKPEVVEEGE